MYLVIDNTSGEVCYRTNRYDWAREWIGEEAATYSVAGECAECKRDWAPDHGTICAGCDARPAPQLRKGQ